MKRVYVLMAMFMIATTAIAQDDEDEGTKEIKGKKSTTISYGTGGLKISNTEGKSEKKHNGPVSVDFIGLDLGVNALQDNTSYSSAIAKAFLQVPQNLQNTNLFDLRTAKSINVNIWPVMARVRMVNAAKQKIYFSTGVGLQIYNFRYTHGVEHVNNPLPAIRYDSLTKFNKNKLTVTYLSLPLQFTFKTKLDRKLWLVYGFGVTGGYRVNSYTKQVSPTYGKQKDHGNFGLENFNGCVTGEFGLDNYFRLFASYQLTNMYKENTGLDQRPFSIGLRFGGI